MYYLDTSFIAPAFIREAASTQVIDWLKKTPADSLYASLWVKTEFASLLARRVRMKASVSTPLASVAWMQRSGIRGLLEGFIPGMRYASPRLLAVVMI